MGVFDLFGREPKTKKDRVGVDTSFASNVNDKKRR